MPLNTNKPSIFRRIRAWIRRHPRWSLIILGIVLIAGTSATAWYLYQSQPVPEPYKPAAVAPKPEPEPVYYSPLTGVEVPNESDTKRAVTAIMLENSPDARPQSGLKESGVVYEAIAEGGITRFLALYQQEKPSLVGPVRSLRMYYVDWLAPYDASVAHVGGSAASLREIRNGNYRDIDQFFNPNTYWRATDRWAPHNVYTNFSRIDSLNKQKGYTSSNPKVFARTDTDKAETPTATRINVTMSSALYNSSYAYNSKTNTYDRSQGGAPHTDREKGRISPRVVIVMKSPMTLVHEDGWRQQYRTTGTGQATIFQDGTVTQATWHKASRSDQIRFTDDNNKEIKLARGQTWISIVPSDTGGVSWQ